MFTIRHKKAIKKIKYILLTNKKWSDDHFVCCLSFDSLAVGNPEDTGDEHWKIEETKDDADDWNGDLLGMIVGWLG